MLIPLALTLAGLFAAVATYRGIRRGGARFYTLEREAILRRAAFSLAASVLLFLAAIGLMFTQLQQTTQSEAAETDAVVEGEATATPTPPEVEVLPPPLSPTPTEDTSLPTATPTPIICRAIVQGTQGNGLLLRSTPGGEEITTLPEATLITLVADEPSQEVNGLVWRMVSSVVSGEEGWVAQDYLEIEPGCE